MKNKNHSLFWIIVLLSAFVGGSLMLPTAALAGENMAIPLSTEPYPMEGKILGGGEFKGTMTITGFESINGIPSIVGSLEGTVTDTAGNEMPVQQTASLPISGITATPPGAVPGQVGPPGGTPPGQTGNCLALNLQATDVLLELELLGLSALLDVPETITLTATAPEGTRICNLLNGVVDLLTEVVTSQQLINLLNELLASLAGQVGGLTPPAA